MQVAAQIRQNSKEYSDFVTDLHKWTSQAEREMSGSQEELIDLSVQESVVSSTQGKEYYKKWEEFDVEKELENVDYAVIKTDDSQKFKRVKEGLLRKEMGNEYYKKGFYKKALSEYTASLALDFNEKTLGNRALVWLKMEMYQECVNDCSKLIAMDAKCIKGYWRRGVAKCSLGDLDAARKDLEYALVLEPGNKSIREELQKVMDLLSVKKEVKPSRPERVRVEIKEIGVSTNEEIRAEEQPNQEFIVQDQKKENIKSLEKIIEIMDISEMELREPGCFMDFERDFKRVKKDKQVLYKYIKVILLKTKIIRNWTRKNSRVFLQIPFKKSIWSL